MRLVTLWEFFGVKGMKRRGAGCSASGNKYELDIAGVCRQVRSPHISIPLSTAVESELGGSGSGTDIHLNWKADKDIGCEAKHGSTPDWMQMSLKRTQDGKWVSSKRAKISPECRGIFENIIGGLNLYSGKIPPFMDRKITYEEWIIIKKENPEFEDTYLSCDENTIAQLYKAKGCPYIQVAGKGLFHTGEDPCMFGVPYFACPQQVRIRTKVHKTKDSKGFMRLSVMAAAQPVKFNSIMQSPFSLDSMETLPKNLLPLEESLSPTTPSSHCSSHTTTTPE